MEEENREPQQAAQPSRMRWVVLGVVLGLFLGIFIPSVDHRSAARFVRHVANVTSQAAKSLPYRRPTPPTTGGSTTKQHKRYFPNLTRELVASVAQNNVVLVTWANFHYLDFVQNWVGHLRKLNVTNFIVGSMDDELLAALQKEGVASFGMQSNLSRNDFGWGSKQFHKMGREKISLVSAVLDLGFEVLVCDVDTVWMRDPNDYVARFPEIDVLVSTDSLRSTKMAHEVGLEDPRLAGGDTANIGILFFRLKARNLVEEWDKWLRNDSVVWDQVAFNVLLKQGWDLGKGVRPGAYSAYNGTLQAGVLPVHLFSSGHVFFVQQMHKKYNVTAYAAHATFQYSGTDGKRHRFREALEFYDPPEYYNRPGGYLVYSPKVDTDLLRTVKPEGKAGVAKHFAIMNPQIIQVRQALALAIATNRSLIMPPLTCAYDRAWFPHDGVFPGSDLTIPFVCPMDYVFDVEAWRRPDTSPEALPVSFREYSFLDNPRTPKLSRYTVQPTDIPEGGFNETTARTFSQSHPESILDFGELILTAWKHFGWEKRDTWFEQRSKTFTSLWCCSVPPEPKRAGHIWYDMWFDKIPRTDRHNRKWNTTWEPIYGP